MHSTILVELWPQQKYERQRKALFFCDLFDFVLANFFLFDLVCAKNFLEHVPVDIITYKKVAG